MSNMRSRHRQRTRVRGHLPGWLSWIALKGEGCGVHEWYRRDGETWACYHCEATRKQEPFSPAESVELRLIALRGALARADSPPSADDRATITRLAAETELAAQRLREKVEGSPEQVIAEEADTAARA